MSTVQITEVLGEGNFEEHSFCDECAQKYLFEVAPPKKKQSVEVNSPTEKACDHCGTKFADFRNSGRLGCPHDYQVFRAELVPLLESIHGATRHAGKTPRRPASVVRAQDLQRLKKELQKAVAAEDYERAAELRDQIKAIDGE